MSTAPDTLSLHRSPTPPPGFVAFPYELYRGDPAWAPPLRMERRAQLSPKSNPGAALVQPTYVLAKRNGRIVGRIAVFLNKAHEARYGADDCFFGYFDCEDDVAVEDALLSEAKTIARELGRARLLGPAMFSVNEEIGLLVDGFEHPNAVLMPPGRPHQVTAVERHGFTKTVDLLCYLADLSNGAPSTRMVDAMCRIAERDEAITWRHLDRKNFERDVDTAMGIFNDAWSENWGFLPFPPDQIEHMAKEMKPIIFDEGFWVGMIDERPVAFIWMIPDVNEVARGFDGKLLPFNWAKFLYRLKAKKVTKSRIPLMGLSRELHGTRKGLAIVAKLCQLAFDHGHKQGFTQCELSWILEDNESMKAIAEQAGAVPYKTYRIYETSLEAGT